MVLVSSRVVVLIKDPIKLVYGDFLHGLGEIGSEHFIIFDGGNVSKVQSPTSLCLIRIVGLWNIQYCWKIKFLRQEKRFHYQIDYGNETRERMLEFIKKNHPDHYEWLLWNQEWI